jgi:uncharacterized protein (TIGR02300 family)
MPAAELGVKRRCLSCTAPFFDMNRSPIACPKCGAAFTVVELPRHPSAMRAIRAKIPMPVAPVGVEAGADSAEDDTSDEDTLPEIEDEEEEADDGRADRDPIIDEERDEDRAKL